MFCLNERSQKKSYLEMELPIHFNHFLCFFFAKTSSHQKLQNMQAWKEETYILKYNHTGKAKIGISLRSVDCTLTDFTVWRFLIVVAHRRVFQSQLWYDKVEFVFTARAGRFVCFADLIIN